MTHKPENMHTQFEFGKNYQNKGYSKKISKELLKQYENCGISKILLHADKTTGGWAWARYGFCVNKDEIENFLIQISDAQHKEEMKKIFDD